MTNTSPEKNAATISTLKDLASLANYSLMDTLNCDPDATENGVDHAPRQVFSGHYVPVNPTPISQPEYIAHSKTFFNELGFCDSMAQSVDFMRMFSGDTSKVPVPMRKTGWATGYALSIYGREYFQQCPFRTGNGYGDGRAISVLEAVINGQRWEMQLKGGGQTPYCRGADGRAVLRSSIREFLAQEHMYALGVPTSRSLSLYVSKTDTVQRPWYSPGSLSQDPDRYFDEPTAISTRVAPSFLRVGQLELFARRVRFEQHPAALEELEKIVLHAIDREYSDEIDSQLSTPDKVLLLARKYQDRLSSLVANWIRVGFCQGNFNSDNCAVGGFTLDYGPFGFCDSYQPYYQPWTGGGQHFSFMNQPNAAHKNFEMFCSALQPLLAEHQDKLAELEQIQDEFSKIMNTKMKTMLAAKLGLRSLKTEADQSAFNLLIGELETLMTQTPVDYTIFFRELSSIPSDISPLKKSFYNNGSNHALKTNANSIDATELDKHWTHWLENWKTLLFSANISNDTSPSSNEEIAKQMKMVNPKYILREWFLVPAYQQAAMGDYALIHELQEIMTQPYAEQSKLIEDKYYRLKPTEYFEVGGLSHLSCSS
ncbi:protein adenylyltransferase SelO [Paraglaciecola sp.]|uniref:protein adenylyltransferase SelO n=1 Tax=Paraglaciecola sp. TaxID=1920173 RepID=UPI003EF1D843